MSISKFREFMEKPGCAWLFGLLMALVAASFIFTGSCSQGFGGGNNAPDPASNAIAKVGDFPVTEKGVWDMAEQSLSSFAQQFGGQVPPGLQATFAGSAVEQQINAGLLVELAKRKQVSLDDTALMKATELAIDEELANRKQQLVAQNKLKADASPAVVDSIMKKEYGQDAKAFREAILNNYKGMLADPEKRNQIMVGSANTLIMEKLMSEVDAPDDLIKSFYDLYNCKRVFLKTDAHKGEDLVKKADAILAEIKAGLAFEAAMDKYTDDPPGAGKKKRDNVFQVDGKTAGLNEGYAPITKLKAGEIGGPYTLGDGGVSIVKFEVKTNTAPADFEQKKETYKRDYRRDNAAKKLQDSLKELRAEKGLIKWESPGYETFFDMTVWQADPETQKLDPKAKRAKLEEFIKRGEAAKSDPKASRAIPLVLFGAFSQIWSAATEAEKAELTPKRIEILREVLQTSESSELRLELADLLAAKKEGADASDSLRLAASAIASDFTPNGQRVFGDIQSRLIKFKAAGLLTAEQEQNVRSVLDQWKKDKAESEKYEKEQKAAEEKQRKEAEAAQKKEEADKKAAEKKGK